MTRHQRPLEPRGMEPAPTTRAHSSRSDGPPLWSSTKGDRLARCGNNTGRRAPTSRTNVPLVHTPDARLRYRPPPGRSEQRARRAPQAPQIGHARTGGNASASCSAGSVPCVFVPPNEENAHCHHYRTGSIAGFFSAVLNCQQRSRALLIFVNYRLLGCDWCERRLQRVLVYELVGGGSW